ncbi:hypothetical protein ABTD02_18525, partial [Acinetobacter baumannii]
MTAALAASCGTEPSDCGSQQRVTGMENQCLLCTKPIRPPPWRNSNSGDQILTSCDNLFRSRYQKLVEYQNTQRIYPGPTITCSKH